MAQRVAVLLLAVLALSACVSRTGPGGGSPESGSAGVSRELLEHADPCAFLDQEPVTALGETEFEDGLFYTDCTAVVETGTNTLRIRAQLLLEATRGGQAGDWQEKTLRGFTVHTGNEETFGCEREIQVHDDVVVGIWVYEAEDSGTVCDIADTATDAAIDVLLGEEITQLPVGPDSLANQNACALLDDEDVAKAPDIGSADVIPAFGGQSCSWGGELVTEPGLFVSFTRQDVPTVTGPGDSEIDVDGRPAVRSISPADEFGDSLPSCEVAVAYGDGPSDNTEVVSVSVRGNDDPVDSCPLAEELAAKALDRLPG